MNRDELIWICVRTAGLVFLVLAIIQIPNIASSIIYQFMAPDTSTAKISGALIMTALAKLFCYIVSSWYFLNRGNFVYKLLSKKPL